MVQKFKIAILIGIAMGLSLEPAMAFDHKYAVWNSIVGQAVTWHANVSSVDYKALKSDPKALDQYLKASSDVPISEFDQWTRNQQLAFLINSYNAWTIKLILDNYPVKSIKDIGGFFSSPWKKKFFTLLGTAASLDWIEHEKIRPLFNEPRVHFALVCASKGCPGLRAEAYNAEKLNEQLEDATHRFLTDPSRNTYDSENKEFLLSSIFKWYKADFIKAKGSVQEFVFPYLKTTKSQTASEALNVPIKYLDYDWTLNEK